MVKIQFFSWYLFNTAPGRALLRVSWLFSLSNNHPSAVEGLKFADDNGMDGMQMCYSPRANLPQEHI